MGSHGRPASIRCAYTLVEMLIVLAVLAVLVALGWPAVRRMLAKSELRSGAKQVRTALAKTRLDAIESGVAQMFRYRPGADRFEVGPASDPLSMHESGFAASGARGPRADEPPENALPDGVQFMESGGPSDDEATSPSPVAGEGLGVRGFGLPNSGPNRPPPQPLSGPTLAGSLPDWSAPIVFFPNGRSTGARIWLTGSSGYQVEVILRGITGTAQIGPVERVEDSETTTVGRIGNPSYGQRIGNPSYGSGRVRNPSYGSRNTDETAAP